MKIVCQSVRESAGDGFLQTELEQEMMHYCTEHYCVTFQSLSFSHAYYKTNRSGNWSQFRDRPGRCQKFIAAGNAVIGVSRDSGKFTGKWNTLVLWKWI